MHAPDIIRQNGRSGEAVSIAGLTPRAHDKESMEREMSGMRFQANRRRKKHQPNI